MKKACLLICMIFFLISIPVYASDDVGAEETDTILVTSQKRTEDVLDIPETITVLDKSLIEDAGINGMDDIARYTPGLEFENFGSRRHSLTFMRGVKSVHAGGPATAFYVDGVNYSKPYMFDFPLFDVERIEILKGPQGTLYGRNTMAGVISVYTSKPDNESKNEIDIIVNDQEQYEVKGNIKAAVIEDKLFLNLAGVGKKSEGYMENTVSAPGDEGRHCEGGGGRLNLKYLPTDKLDISFSVDGHTYDEGVFPFRRTKRNPFSKKNLPVDKKYKYSHDFESEGETDFFGGSLSVNYSMGAGDIISVTGYRDYSVNEMLDSDFTQFDITRMNYITDETSFSQEIRFVSNDNNKKFKWIAGVYFFNNDLENDTSMIFRPGMAGKPGNPFGTGTGRFTTLSDGQNKGAAVFGQNTYSFNDKFDVTFGLRYEREDAEMSWKQRKAGDNGSFAEFGAASESQDFDVLLPKAGITMHLNDNHMVYFNFAQGHRVGGFNKTAPISSREYSEEKSYIYEIGTKLRLPWQKLSANLCAFYMDIEDEQIHKFSVETNKPYLVNAGESHRLGIESELNLEIIKGLDFNLGFTFIEAEYDKHDDPITGINYEDNKVFSVPEYTVNTGLQYRRPVLKDWVLLTRVNALFKGERYFDDANTVKEDPYGLVDAKIGLESESLDFYFWCENVFDKHYIVLENTGKGIAEDGSPRVIGANIAYRF